MTLAMRGKLVRGSSCRVWGLGGRREKPKGLVGCPPVRRRGSPPSDWDDTASSTTSTSSVRQRPAPYTTAGDSEVVGPAGAFNIPLDFLLLHFFSVLFL